MRSKTRSLFLLHVRVFLLLVSLAAPATGLAQDIVTAEALFHSGLADMEAGRYGTGCKALAESQRLDPRTGTLFTLASCEERWGHIATAVTRFTDYITQYERLPDDRKAAQAARHKVAVETRDRLLPEVPRWTLSLPVGAPVGTVVRRDGEVVPGPALGLSLPIDPGEHTVSTQAPGGPLLEKKIEIVARQTLALTLEVAPVKADEPPPDATALPATTATPAGAGPSRQGWIAYVLGGAGVAGLIAGGVMGGLVLEKKGVTDEHCGSAIGQADSAACDRTGLNAANGAQDIGLGSTLGFALGGVALGTALVLFVTQPRPTAPAAGKRSAWISAGAVRMGPEGAILGVRGGF